MKFDVQFGHDPGKNPFNLGTGRPDGGSEITTFMFWPITFPL